MMPPNIHDGSLCFPHESRSILIATARTTSPCNAVSSSEAQRMEPPPHQRVAGTARPAAHAAGIPGAAPALQTHTRKRW